MAVQMRQTPETLETYRVLSEPAAKVYRDMKVPVL